MCIHVYIYTYIIFGCCGHICQPVKEIGHFKVVQNMGKEAQQE